MYLYRILNWMVARLPWIVSASYAEIKLATNEEGISRLEWRWLIVTFFVLLLKMAGDSSRQLLI
jgi:hypothetical protein